MEHREEFASRPAGAEGKDTGRHPRAMGAGYLRRLAIERNVAASTQNAALAGLLFLYRDVLHVDLSKLGGIERARRLARLPTVLARVEEVERMRLRP